MLDSWKRSFQRAVNQTGLEGWNFASEDDCRDYLSQRVLPKLQQSEPISVLCEYLIEMADTGFDTMGLQKQADSPPVAKDWEIGEAFAEAMLEDKFEASFPWPTSWDKRTPKASLPGPDLPGFERRDTPRFLFGEVKSSSEAQSPPQVADTGEDCLREQVNRLLTSEKHRQQLIGWLLVRAKESPRWKPIFDAAMKSYSEGDICVCGVLVRGGCNPTIDDLASVQEDLSASAGTFALKLLIFYIPFEKTRWVSLVYGTESLN